MSRLLFVHQNFPGQFKHLAPALARSGRHEVAALHARADLPATAQGMRLVRYAPRRETDGDIHPWLRHLDAATAQAESAFAAALKLRDAGYVPDVVIGHHGWGETMFLNEVWPGARIGIYCEMYYRAVGSSWTFDPEFSGRNQPASACLAAMMNIPADRSMQFAVAGLSPTHWQANTFPPAMRERITVAHDGIDTRRLAPNPGAALALASGRTLTRDDEVVTFVSRNLEPYRGFHTMMRALPALLKARPKAEIVLVGDDRPGYGPPPVAGSWKEIFSREIAGRLAPQDHARVHFTGRLDYDCFVALLQVSTVHVYLTYPFVLSWSLLEAMSAGCAIVASDTAPVREMIEADRTGVLVDFFDAEALAATIGALAGDAARRSRLSQAARHHICGHFDIRSCGPRQVAWIEALAASQPRDGGLSG